MLLLASLLILCETVLALILGARLDLTEEGYAQAVKNVDAYRSVLANVKDGAGIDFDDAKDSVDALFKYVEDMIRDEIDQQVDALEELKDMLRQLLIFSRFWQSLRFMVLELMQILQNKTIRHSMSISKMVTPK